MLKQIKHTLNDIAKDITANIKNPNWGGCCVIASEVGKHLQKYSDLGVDCWLRVLDSYFLTKTAPPVDVVAKFVPFEPSKAMTEFNNNGIRFGHVVLEFTCGKGKHLWDSNGVVSRFKYLYNKWENDKLYRGRLPVEVGVLISKANMWNKDFNRRQIPKIRAIVAKHFAALDEKLENT